MCRNASGFCGFPPIGLGYFSELQPALIAAAAAMAVLSAATERTAVAPAACKEAASAAPVADWSPVGMVFAEEEERLAARYPSFHLLPDRLLPFCNGNNNYYCFWRKRDYARRTTELQQLQLVVLPLLLLVFLWCKFPFLNAAPFLVLPLPRLPIICLQQQQQQMH